MIGLPDKEIIYTRPQDGAFVRLPRTAPVQRAMNRRLTMVPRPRPMALRDASIAYYGQKSGNFCAITRKTAFLKRLEELAIETKEKKKQPDAPRLRIYNLAGNPIMLALIDGKIDVIFETEGQRCHDVVAGFIIALQAGASLKNLDTGENLNEQDIVTVLENPSTKFRYVMACNEQLANEVVQLLKSKNGPVIEFKDPSLVTAEEDKG